MALSGSAALAEPSPFNREQAQQGLSLVKSAIINLLFVRKRGVTNSEIVRELGLESDQNGTHKNLLSWSVLGLLMREGRVKKSGKYYFLIQS